MSESTASQADVRQRQWAALQLVLKAIALAILVFFQKAGHIGLWVLRKTGRIGLSALRSSGRAVGRAASGIYSAIASIRLPVLHSTHLRVVRQLGRFEREVISSVRTIECREKRTRSFLGLARTAYEMGRDTTPFLIAAIEELREEQYWMRKQPRIFSAAQLACAVAGLAARSGHLDLASDAYLIGQTLNGKVDGVDRKIGLAVAFADVAHLMNTYSDRVSWLATAMELASGIDDKVERLGAVSFVARKMVTDQVAPFSAPLVDKRFTVDVAAMAVLPVEEATTPKKADAPYDEFAIEMPT